MKEQKLPKQHILVIARRTVQLRLRVELGARVRSTRLEQQSAARVTLLVASRAEPRQQSRAIQRCGQTTVSRTLVDTAWCNPRSTCCPCPHGRTDQGKCARSRGRTSLGVGQVPAHAPRIQRRRTRGSRGKHRRDTSRCPSSPLGRSSVRSPCRHTLACTSTCLQCMPHGLSSCEHIEARNSRCRPMHLCTGTCL